MTATDYLTMLRTKNEDFLPEDRTAQTAQSTLHTLRSSPLAGKSSNFHEEPGGVLSCWWRVTFHDGGVRTIFTPSPDSPEGLLRAYPAATDAQPFTPTFESPDATMSVTEQTAIKDWLARIDEQSQEVIDEVMVVCERNAGARAYALERSKVDVSRGES